MDRNLSLCLPYLLDDKCVLFLGPRFARDKQGRPMYQLLQEQLEASPDFAQKLDYGFDNLFIFKNPKPQPTDKLWLNQALKELYAAAEPHAVYDQLAQLPFRAIVLCSPDLMLKNCIDRLRLGVNHYFYSPNRNDSQPAVPGWPILFNVFGNIEVEDSLITTYPDFFKFVISVLGDEQQIPLDLKNAVASAKIFLFCGFDLTKWYIPLLMHKLHQFKEASGNTDISAVVDHDNQREENVERLYPVQMLWLDDKKLATIDELYRAVDQKGRLRKPDAASKRPVYDAVRKLITDNKLDEAIALLLTAYRQKNKPDNEIILLQSRKTRNDRDIAAGKITGEQYKVEQTNIENATLAFADQADKF